MRVSSGQWTWFLTNGSAFRLLVALAFCWCFLLPKGASQLDGLHLLLLSLAVAPMFCSGVVLWSAVTAVVWVALTGEGPGLDGWHILLLLAAAAARLAWVREVRRPRPCRAFAAASSQDQLGSVLMASASELAARMRAGELSAIDVVELFITQAAAADTELNAVVAHRFDAARAEAAEAERRYSAARSAGDGAARNAALAALPPFLGVPVFGKACMELPGLPFTCGLVARAGVVGERAAPPLRRLRAAGFVFLGVGNLSEACMWMESYNAVYGRSCNPYDLRRTCGGSSGGTAAMVAVCGAPVGVTSDVGGSTRIPAFFNGLFGHKPTGGLVSNARCIPTCEGGRKRFCQVGPTARHAADLMPLLRLMAGESEAGVEGAEQPQPVEEADGKAKHDEFGTRAPALLPLGDPGVFLLNAPAAPSSKRRGGGGGGSSAASALRGLRVIDCSLVSGGSALVSARDPELVAAQERVAAWLRDVGGCELVPFPPALQPEMRAAFDIWSAMLSSGDGHTPFRTIIAQGRAGGPAWIVWELLKLLLFGAAGSDHTLPALGLALVERVPELLPAPTEALRVRGVALRQQLTELLGDGVMLYPTLPTVAPLHDGACARIMDSGATALWNVMELPVTAVPLGLGKCSQMPLGVQVVAAPGQDHKSIGVALALQEAGIAGWQPPPPQGL